MMFTLPVAAFYIALKVFADKEQPDNWAGGSAIIVTNLIVGVYSYLALTEPDDEEEDAKNDRSAPRVGAFKQRAD